MFLALVLLCWDIPSFYDANSSGGSDCRDIQLISALNCLIREFYRKSENRFLTISNWAIYPQYYIWNHELTLQVVAVHSGRCSTVLHRFAFQSFLSLDKLAVGVEESHI
jgi:hypothetical protein